jgi:RND family efflux transporter MFP subunit
MRPKAEGQTRAQADIMAGIRSSALVALSVVTMACGGGEHAPEARGPEPVTVSTIVVRHHALAEPIEVGGTVRARQQAVLTSRIVGQVREVRVNPGDRVLRGQVLAVLDGREMDANRVRADAMLAAAAQQRAAAEAEQNAAAAALALARVTHERVGRLRERKSATAQELDEAAANLTAAESRVSAARAGLEAARASLEGARAGADAAGVASGYSRITAPFDGTVTEKHVDAGTMAMPGTPILSVEQGEEYRVEVRLDENRAARVNWDALPRVQLDGPAGESRMVEGRVAERARAMDDAHTVVVKVALPVTALRSGMFARVIFSGPAGRRLAIPEESLVSRGQLDAVFVVEGDTARYRVVEVGRRGAALVEIRAGLSEGERLVSVPPPSLVDGTPVEVR